MTWGSERKQSLSLMPEAAANGCIHVHDAVLVRVVSIDRRWRDLGRASVLVEWRVADEPPALTRLEVDDLLRTHININIGE